MSAVDRSFLKRSIPSLSAYRQVCEDARKSFAMYGCDVEMIAEDVKYAVRAELLRRGVDRTTARVTAYRVTRPLRHAAKCQAQAAKSMRLAYVRAATEIAAATNQGRPQKRKRVFDLDG